MAPQIAGYKTHDMILWWISPWMVLINVHKTPCVCGSCSQAWNMEQTKIMNTTGPLNTNWIQGNNQYIIDDYLKKTFILMHYSNHDNLAATHL